MKKKIYSGLLCAMGVILTVSCGSKSSAHQERGNMPNICFLDTFQAMGIVERENPIGKVDFRFVNTGSNPIVVLDVRPSCTCTTVEFDHSPIMPGDTSCIRAIYHGEGRNPEFFSKEVVVYTSASSEDVILSFEGELK